MPRRTVDLSVLCPECKMHTDVLKARSPEEGLESAKATHALDRPTCSGTLESRVFYDSKEYCARVRAQSK